MIFPVGVDYEAQRYPVVTLTLIGINIVVFVLEIFAFATGNGTALFGTFGLVPSHSLLWAWVTNLFLHGGFLHLLGNMVYLYLFGACVEDILGRGRFIGFYLVGGVISNFIQFLFTSGAGADVPIIGASGAISACIGAFLVVLPKSQVNFRYLFWFYTGDFWLRSSIVISFWFLENLLGMILDLSAESATGGVAFAAHVGGTIFGAIAILPLRPKKVTESKPKSEPNSRPVRTRRPLEILLSTPEADSVDPVYLYVNGKEVGPFSTENVRRVLTVDRIPSEALFWKEGMGEWRPLAEL